MLTFGELFAGVGGFSLGFEQAGWECRWQVEWDRHCQQVLARHWPEVTRYGDVTEVDGAAIAPVTCITFGSPCQDLSVAGKRAGLDGARSGLFFEAIRIIKEMRDATAGTLPRFAIWENVAGALSSNKGDDFLAVLDAFAEIGAVDIAWRLVDAQHFGVPQRRRRVFVVADFGGESAGSIHAEPAGVLWHPASGGTAGKDVAGGVACGLGADSRIAGPLGSNAVGGHRGDLDNAGAYVVQEVVGTLSAGAHPGGFNGQDAYNGHLIMQPIPVQDGRDIDKRQNGLGIGQEGDPMYTIDQTGSQSVVQPSVVGMINMQGSKGNAVTNAGDISFSLNAMHGHDVHAIVQPFVKGKRASSPDDDESWRVDQVSPTLNAFDNGSESRATVTMPNLVGPLTSSGMSRARGTESIESNHVIQTTAATVRRLTPLECERLNGFPDHHTRWRADGTEQSDSQRYRQMGNAVAVPCAAWLAWNLTISLQQENNT